MRIFTKQADSGAPPEAPRWEAYESPFGRGAVLVAAGLPLRVELPGGRIDETASDRRGHWARSLERYFAGERVAFGLDVCACALALGLTDFESAVYAALADVPYGAVISYGGLGAAVGRPHAYRAVGSAMARNTLPVLLPCHRVIRSDGRLGDYGDDPSWKERLLELEGVAVRERRLV